jgi:hypothetical protein
MAETVSKAEMQLIAQDAATRALDEHTDNLPRILRPMCYDVAEIVAKRQEQALHALISNIFGADVTDKNQVREVQRDLFYLRDKRTDHDKSVRVVKDQVIRSAVRVGILLFFAGCMLYLGFNLKAEAGNEKSISLLPVPARPEGTVH